MHTYICSLVHTHLHQYTRKPLNTHEHTDGRLSFLTHTKKNRPTDAESDLTRRRKNVSLKLKFFFVLFVFSFLFFFFLFFAFITRSTVDKSLRVLRPGKQPKSSRVRLLIDHLKKHTRGGSSQHTRRRLRRAHGLQWRAVD